MQEFHLILGNNRKDVTSWGIIKHQIMDVEKYGRIPSKNSFSVAWKNFLKVVLNFSLKVKYSICVTDVQQVCIEFLGHNFSAS